MAAVLLACGHDAEVDHAMGERLVRCVSCGVEHVVAAVHTNAVTYAARRRHPEPEPKVEEHVDPSPATKAIFNGAMSLPNFGVPIIIPAGIRLVDIDHAEAQL